MAHDRVAIDVLDGNPRCGRGRRGRPRPVRPAVRAGGVRLLGRPLAGPAYPQELDDAVQEVFMACLRESGALTRAAPAGRAGSTPTFTAWCGTSPASSR